MPVNPKSYWIWNHRKWTIEMMNELNSQQPEKISVNYMIELYLCSELLNVDARNCN